MEAEKAKSSRFSDCSAADADVTNFNFVVCKNLATGGPHFCSFVKVYHLQGDPSGLFLAFVDIKTKVQSHYRLLILQPTFNLMSSKACNPFIRKADLEVQ